MWCSNVVRAPSHWVHPHKEILKQKQNDELVGMNDLIDWATETGVTTEVGARMVFEKLNVYFYLRCLYPNIPNDPTSVKLCQLNLHFIILGYIVDDKIEKYNEREIHELCRGFHELDQEASKMFPQSPSISEMKQSLTNVKNEFSKATLVMMMDYITKYAALLLDHGVELTSQRVFNFRSRLSNAISIYFCALRSKTESGSDVTEGEMLWRRCFDALALPIYMAQELFTKMAEMEEEPPLAVLNELYLLSILYCIVINDLYSYSRDKFDDSDNVLKVWFQENKVSNMREAGSQTCQILNAIVQHMYILIERRKMEYPCAAELFESIAYMTAGWIFIHNTVVPRYEQSPFQVVLEEVEESALPKWLIQKNEYGHAVVREFIETMKETNQKNITYSLSGLVEEKSGLVEKKPGLVEEKSGMVEEKSGLVEEKSGLVEEKSGLVEEKSGLVEGKSGLGGGNIWLG